MSRKLVIEFSLVDESIGRTRSELLRDIEDFLKSEDVVIPWCDRFLDVTICDVDPNVKCCLLKKSIKQVVK